ncbi:MAG TPA: substrate-binding domain-containing protein, partial [Rubellimicrobium sp.]|nr:substrate-binding domain-containing protein [Rubellimicrobium sp.]
LIGDKGNVIVVRGVAGSGPDEQMYAAQMAVLAQHPDVKVVAEVIGQATASEAQQAIANILPSLPQVDAVLAQGGSDDYGIAQAFEQYGGPYAEAMPVIEGGGSSDFIIWWNRRNQTQEYKTAQAEATLDLIGDKGNVIVVRGVAGSGPDEQMYAAQMAVLAQHPDVKVVAEVIGQATASEAQQAIANILPSLPKVDAVLAQGGSDDYGIAQAFEQYGGPYADAMPVIEGGGSSDFIIWWNQRNQAQEYKTTSMNTTPGIGGAAFWLAYEITQGAQPPMEMTMPVAVVEAETLATFAEGLEPGFIISPSYDRTWVQENLLSN